MVCLELAPFATCEPPVVPRQIFQHEGDQPSDDTVAALGDLSVPKTVSPRLMYVGFPDHVNFALGCSSWPTAEVGLLLVTSNPALIISGFDASICAFIESTKRPVPPKLPFGGGVAQCWDCGCYCRPSPMIFSAFNVLTCSSIR